MAAYAYKGRDIKGTLLQGIVDATDPATAADTLISRGITPIEIGLATSPARPLAHWLSWRSGGITDEDIMLFSRQMYTLMRAGVPILQALGGLRESTHNPAFAALLERLRDSLDSGRELSIAIHESGAFNSFYTSMVRVGEMTGKLDVIFLQLFEQLEFEKDMRSKIKAAVRYPIFVICAMIVAMILLNVMVIPAFAKVFAQFNTPLPLMTRILIGVSQFTTHYWYVLALALVAVILGVQHYINTPRGRWQWDRAKLSLPIVGSVVRKATLARFARSFSMSLGSGLPITQGFSVVAQVVDNAYIAEKLLQMRNGVERGDSLPRTAAASGIFTPVVLQMIAVGDESGDVDGLLREVADMYDREVKYEVDKLSARIEPILIVFLAGLVLVMALGVFLPLWDLSSAMLRRP